uniref:Uncharacterized protein n=1 Tax=Anguilla anguilla TaxID=7936 RepID=A0A0E9TYR5_ANGAN
MLCSFCILYMMYFYISLYCTLRQAYLLLCAKTVENVTILF